jgi:membrane protein
MWPQVKQVLRNAFTDIMQNHTMALAAGLSYYFVLSLFPLLILAAALVAYLPIPNLFDSILGMMSRVVPADSMGLVRKIVASVITRRRSGLLTFGIIATIWSASGGFNSLIEALDVAYDVPETRPIWKTRLLSIELMFLIGALMVVGIGVMLVGPQFGGFLANKVGLSEQFADMWNVLRWCIAIGFLVLAVELIYFLAPNVRQRFTSTLPGAAIGVGTWIGTSYGLSLYFQHYANFNKTYGTLGAAIALMVWLYYSWFAILVGAEINSEIIKLRTHKTLPLKQAPPPAVEPRPAWEEKPAREERPAA